MIWSHKEQWLVTGDDEGKIRYFQTSLNKVMEFAAHYRSAHAVDAPRLADLPLHSRRDEGPDGLPQLAPVREISLSPTDNKLASGSDDATVKIWDFENCTCERTLKALGSEVKTVQWHPFKALIASGGKDNMVCAPSHSHIAYNSGTMWEVRLWDPRMGKKLSEIDAHKRDVTQLRWNANGNWLLSSGRDSVCRLFDIRMMRELRKFRGHPTEVIRTPPTPLSH
jgi:polyadenylation factor subunit 2